MLKQSDLDKIYHLLGGFVNEIKIVNCAFIGDANGLNPLQALDLTSSFIFKKFEKINSHYKRSKLFKSHPLYVAPQEMAVGTRFEIERDKQNMVAIPQRIQSTFEYVSLIDTLKSLFKRDDFKSQYFEHNSVNQSKHTCVDGVYERFCCGKKYKNTELFQTNKDSLQIQIATDDFEPCNPLQSKSGSHKICAVYFVIRNMPAEYLSKLKNIYLICLCNSNDLKTKQTDFNNIWTLIVNDISHLENVGIDIGNNVNIKGTIAYLSFDNLGGNTSLGLVESFQSYFYCRICELPKDKCQLLTKEDPKILRNRNSYNAQLAIVDMSEKVNYSQTKGIKRLCVLNDLKYFHMIENISVDIMHDLNEGTIPFIMKRLFDRCIALKVFTEKELIKLIRFYDFGRLNSKNKPSQLAIDKKTLGQNGAQSRCLFLHLPFILSKYKTNYHLAEMWICIKSLLKICQIAYSSKIIESEVVILENEIHVHLNSIQKNFKCKLTPKHHLLTHYCSVIRTMGPLLPMSMMRFESKHKYFKDNIRRSNNFININRSLTLKHQEFMSKQENGYEDEMTTGAKKILCETFTHDHAHIFASEITHKSIAFEVKWLRYNGIMFKQGLMILNASVVFEIIKILCIDNIYNLFCNKYDNYGLDKYSNSLEIKQCFPITCRLIKFKELEHGKIYEKKKCMGKCYIIADTLALKNIVVSL